LERLIDAARRSPATAVAVHVVEPNRPGGGLYAAGEPDYFVLNTPCGQHSMYPFPELVHPERLGKGFYEWLKDKGWRWDALNCSLSPAGVEIGPYDFVPRRLMGQYLEWFYEVLVAEAPPNISIFHHETRAVDVEPTEAGRERVHLENGRALVVDHVALTSGHMKGCTPATSWPRPLEPYPTEAYVRTVKPGDKVAIEGMGLVALDVVMALTVGLGGRYSTRGDGKLRYHPSGREPQLYMYSRTGYPYCAKSFGAADPMGDYRPGICTPEAVMQLKRSADGGKRPIDARRELLPLVFAEMELCYHLRSAEVVGGRKAAERARKDLVKAWQAGRFEDAVSRYALKYGEFRAADHFFVGDGARYSDTHEYESHVYGVVSDDVAAALEPGGSSPLKAAYETLRALRDTLRLAVEFKGLTLASHLDFQQNLRGRFARLVAGPPAVRSQQLLALMDAGVLSLPFGPSPSVSHGAGGKATVCSTRLAEPVEVAVDVVVRAHLEPPSLGGTGSPLLANLLRRGRLRPLTFDGTAAGGIDIDEEFHPLDGHGKAAERLWIFGVLSEGARYFTLYIPSPKSRSRAFLDAEVLADRVVGAEAARPGGEATQASDGPGHRRVGRRALQVALVNNMPDGAFAETEDRWADLLLGDRSVPVEIGLYTVPGVPRGPEVRARIEERYLGLDALKERPPDALVVTGAEPTVVDLHEEPFWEHLAGLLTWAGSEVPSMIASCMSAHAALLCFDGLNRRLRLEKCSGVFSHLVDNAHPLMAEVTDLWLPHSRWNEVPTEELEAAGYRALAKSPEAGWAVAVGERAGCQLVLLQGHPEYEPFTLLREYRRDVRRYLSGTQGSYPRPPAGYLGDEASAALAEFEARALAGPRHPALMEDFPFELAKGQVAASWDGTARRLMSNWLGQALQRAEVVRDGRLPVATRTPVAGYTTLVARAEAPT
jgi:homoserine O-succinyltransferase